jgi:hypothetical protein
MCSLDAFDAIKELNVLVESGLKNVYLRSNHGKVKKKAQREWGFLNLKLRLAGPSASLALKDVSFVRPHLC